MTDDREPTGEILLYRTPDGRTRVECRFADETLWLSQALMAELFQTTPQNITQHLKAIFEEGELDEAATCKDFLQVRNEGSRSVRRRVRQYRLEAILAVGYRLDEFLRFNERDVLGHKGQVKKAVADAHAEAEYERFAKRRRALLEAEAERAQERALEDAARELPAPAQEPPGAHEDRESEKEGGS